MTFNEPRCKVIRTYVADSKKIGRVDVELQPGSGREFGAKLSAKSFSASVIGLIGELKVGQYVQLSGTIGSECVKDRAKNDVQVDGYKLWIPALNVTEIVNLDTGETTPGPVGDLPKPPF